MENHHQKNEELKEDEPSNDDGHSPAVSPPSSFSSSRKKARKQAPDRVRATPAARADRIHVPTQEASQGDDEDDSLGYLDDLTQEMAKLSDKPASMVRRLIRDYPEATPDVLMRAILDTIAARDRGEIKKSLFGFLRTLIDARLAEGTPKPKPAPKPSPPPRVATPPPPPRPAPPPESPEQAAARLEAEAREKAEKLAELRRKDAVNLVDSIRRYYFEVAENGETLDLVDAFPRYASDDAERDRIERARLCRDRYRSRFVGQLNALRPEVEDIIRPAACVPS